jgi:hypothetical protein
MMTTSTFVLLGVMAAAEREEYREGWARGTKSYKHGGQGGCPVPSDSPGSAFLSQSFKSIDVAGWVGSRDISELRNGGSSEEDERASGAVAVVEGVIVPGGRSSGSEGGGGGGGGGGGDDDDSGNDGGVGGGGGGGVLMKHITEEASLTGPAEAARSESEAW